MQRKAEPELMDDALQARAYAAADFEAPHNKFIALFQRCFPDFEGRETLDLGCGPGDISRRFARAYPGCLIHGIDGAQAMLEEAHRLTPAKDQAQIQFHCCLLPQDKLPQTEYDGLISNSLLHHLHDPLVLWQTINDYSGLDAYVFVMDLLRPDSEAEAQTLVDIYAEDEPELLRHDFYLSLLAAYRTDEVETQLLDSGIDYLRTEVASDRHFIVYGRKNQEAATS